YIVLSRPFCFEPSNRYEVSIRFQRHGVAYRHLTAFVLIDSGSDPDAEQHREDMIRYMCLDSFMITPMPALAEMCSKLICSISANIHDGALPCQCDPQGSISSECDKVGGQCRCKANVIGRRCDQCAPGTYGFGVSGCTATSATQLQVSALAGREPPGANAQTANQASGASRAATPVSVTATQTSVIPGQGSAETADTTQRDTSANDHFNGHSCYTDYTSDQIICNCKQGYSGYYGNPEQPGGQCLPCECNNNIDTQDPGSCDPRTGQCLRCLYHTDGPSCSQCKAGYYGNALIKDCRHCNCHPLGSQMAQCNRETGQCECRDEMAGARCDECARGFTGIFPNCVCCHQCFQLWDDYLCQMRRDLDHIQYNIQRILESGITPGVGNDRIKELEQKLKQVQDLIDAGDTDKIHQLIGQRMDDLRWATIV
ncbi:hypothetical protein GOODEAATRI_020431, partial [Goodea atripinnis]